MWWLFWTLCFGIGSSGFLLITLIVLVRGIEDLRKMIRSITSRANINY
jgi:hypothetical protein